MDRTDKIFLAILAILVGFFLFGIGVSVGSRPLMDEAVRTGHAEYYLDADHNKQWRFLPVHPEDRDER